VTVLQVFRDLFAEDVLLRGEEISVGSVTIMFTDLCESTRLYRNLGDAAAFVHVQEHFDKLKQAEEQFFRMYPGGFEHPDMLAIAKKHGMGRMTDLVRETFSADQFNDPKAVVRAMSKIVSRASLVSLFEKPKFRDYINTLAPQQELLLAESVKETLLGDHKKGFNMMLDILIEGSDILADGSIELKAGAKKRREAMRSRTPGNPWSVRHFVSS